MLFSGKKRAAINYKELSVSVILLLLFWFILSLPSSVSTSIDFFEHLFAGVLLALLVTRLIHKPIFSGEELGTHRLPNLLRLLAYFVYLTGQIFMGGVDVARRVMRPKLNISPGVIKFRTPLQDDLQITINANSITLTPGTITLDVETDAQGSTFWVHCISKQGMEDIKTNRGFVDKILNIYR